MEPHIQAHLCQDLILTGLLTNPPPQWPVRKGSVYASLLRAIIGQQLSGKAAETIHGRFTQLYEGDVPEPAALLTTPIETLRSAGLSFQKAGYLHNVAVYFTAHAPESGAFDLLDDETIIRELTTIKGVGKWTVEMILMFTLGRPDVFPVDDLGIQKAIATLYSIGENGPALKRRMLEIAQPWQPFRSYASFLLWHFLDS